jgi:ankyrin repeat protein
MRAAFLGRWVLVLSLALATPLARAALDDLLSAVRFNDPGAVRKLLDEGYDINSLDRDGNSILMLAVREKSLAVAKLLLDRHPNVNYANPAQETALMFAALQGESDLVRALVGGGARVNQPGWNALHYAAWGGQPEICRYLLDEGADIDATSPNGTTALMLAAREGHYAVVKLLLWEVAEPNVRNEAGATALSMALRRKNTDIAALLRQAGARE